MSVRSFGSVTFRKKNQKHNQRELGGLVDSQSFVSKAPKASKPATSFKLDMFRMYSKGCFDSFES